jgi:hypothetical protein
MATWWAGCCVLTSSWLCGGKLDDSMNTVGVLHSCSLANHSWLLENWQEAFPGAPAPVLKVEDTESGTYAQRVLALLPTGHARQGGGKGPRPRQALARNQQRRDNSSVQAELGDPGMDLCRPWSWWRGVRSKCGDRSIRFLLWSCPYINVQSWSRAAQRSPISRLPSLIGSAFGLALITPTRKIVNKVSYPRRVHLV